MAVAGRELRSLRSPNLTYCETIGTWPAGAPPTHCTTGDSSPVVCRNSSDRSPSGSTVSGPKPAFVEDRRRVSLRGRDGEPEFCLRRPLAPGSRSPHEHRSHPRRPPLHPPAVRGPGQQPPAEGHRLPARGEPRPPRAARWPPPPAHGRSAPSSRREGQAPRPQGAHPGRWNRDAGQHPALVPSARGEEVRRFEASRPRSARDEQGHRGRTQAGATRG